MLQACIVFGAALCLLGNNCEPEEITKLVPQLVAKFGGIVFQVEREGLVAELEDKGSRPLHFQELERKRNGFQET